MAVRLFIGNLPYDTTDTELREHFSPIGRLTQVFLPVDRGRRGGRGFAFIEFEDRAQAEGAINKFNNQLFKGRPLAVKEAQAWERAPPGGGGGGARRWVFALPMVRGCRASTCRRSIRRRGAQPALRSRRPARARLGPKKDETPGPIC
jgi:hypothetical protein